MNIDLRYSYIIEKSLSEYNQGHYYVILAHLSTYFNDSVIIDLGTLRGESAAALSYNKSNKIYTYDIAHRGEAVDRFKNEEYQNIEYIIGDCIENNWMGMPIWDAHHYVGEPPKTDKEIFLSSELIFMDIDPHNGIQEDKVLNFLIYNNWKGVMVCDDIGFGVVGQQHPHMRDWWESITTPKYNISENHYASGTGTGIICFDNQEVIF